MSATEADREKAAALLDDCGVRHEFVPTFWDAIAEALAAEREKAREPFLRALDIIDDGYFAPEPYDKGVRWAANRIRRAAEDQQ